jgi:hypothetical protein
MPMDRNDKEEPANEAMRCLIYLRDTVEDVHVSEVLDELVGALRTGGDHPLLQRWLEDRQG